MTDLFSLPPLAWLANYLLHSSVLLGTAWLLDTFGVLRSARQREFVWRLAFIGALFTASVHSLAPGISFSGEARLPMVQLSTSQSAPAPGVAADTFMDKQDIPARPATITAATDDGTTTRQFRFEWPVAPLLLGLWIFGALFLLTRIAWTARLAMRELAARQPVTRGPLHDRLQNLCARTDPPRQLPRLAVVDDLPGPMTLPNGEICLPRWASEQLSAAQLDAMLAHELAHVQRRDPLLLLMATLLESLLFVQPLNRVAHQRLAALAELNADADAAILTGDTRALAETLAECAQRIHASPTVTRASILGVAMARRRSPVIHRVERLLGGITMHEKRISGALRACSIAALVGTVLLLPAFGLQDAKARTGVKTGTSVVQNDDEMTFEIGRPGYFLRVHAKGEVQFTEDDRGVARVAERLQIREKRNDVVHELEVTNRNGELQHAYSRDGEPMPFAAEAQEWLAVVIPELLRNTGMDAERRIARLHARGGIDAVLDEMKLIKSGHALALYAGILVREHALDEKALQRLFSLLREVDSDFELRQALANVITSRKLSEDSQRQVLEVAASIDSDFEAAELLQLITPQLRMDDRILAAWRSAVDKIGSDFEQRRTLAAVFEHKQLGKAWKVASLQAATAGISSDFELRSLLESAAPHIDGDKQLVRLYIEALNEIGSDFEARQAVATLVENGKLDGDGYSALLDALHGIGSDFETGEALRAIAKDMPRDTALTEKYHAHARKLSAHARQQAEDALE